MLSNDFWVSENEGLWIKLAVISKLLHSLCAEAKFKTLCLCPKTSDLIGTLKSWRSYKADQLLLGLTKTGALKCENNAACCVEQLFLLKLAYGSGGFFVLFFALLIVRCCFCVGCGWECVGILLPECHSLSKYCFRL